ncbi:hypothetical protein B0T11DRAFT_298670 [Plectosphaerella cucumerina]|uniref:Uncharacterized protein n=1 Tax=Plectosphaerella cucumerina TaxID=40658 RepID=A0A8K0X455_9PEZI|nr:hypothetical protein B0T11DRAFT_298670 [Plectosphaerella cucumerina]
MAVWLAILLVTGDCLILPFGTLHTPSRYHAASSRALCNRTPARSSVSCGCPQEWCGRYKPNVDYCRYGRLYHDILIIYATMQPEQLDAAMISIGAPENIREVTAEGDQKWIGLFLGGLMDWCLAKKRVAGLETHNLFLAVARCYAANPADLT